MARKKTTPKTTPAVGFGRAHALMAAKQFKEALVQAVVSCGLSHNQLAKETGIRQQTISRFVSGERSISLENYAVLAAYFRLGPQLARICGK